jgi:hypothetical protein
MDVDLEPQKHINKISDYALKLLLDEPPHPCTNLPPQARSTVETEELGYQFVAYHVDRPCQHILGNYFRP